MRPVITIAPKQLKPAEAVEAPAQPVRDPEIARVLSIIEGNAPVLSAPPSEMPAASSMWSESLDLIEQLGRSARESRERTRTLEAQLQLIVRESANQISVARERIASLETIVQQNTEREQELRLRLGEAEKWLHLIQDALRAQAAPDLNALTPAAGPQDESLPSVVGATG